MCDVMCVVFSETPAGPRNRRGSRDPGRGDSLPSEAGCSHGRRDRGGTRGNPKESARATRQARTWVSDQNPVYKWAFLHVVAMFLQRGWTYWAGCIGRRWHWRRSLSSEARARFAGREGLARWAGSWQAKGSRSRSRCERNSWWVRTTKSESGQRSLAWTTTRVCKKSRKHLIYLSLMFQSWFFSQFLVRQVTLVGRSVRVSIRTRSWWCRWRVRHRADRPDVVARRSGSRRHARTSCSSSQTATELWRSSRMTPHTNTTTWIVTTVRHLNYRVSVQELLCSGVVQDALLKSEKWFCCTVQTEIASY